MVDYDNPPTDDIRLNYQFINQSYDRRVKELQKELEESQKELDKMNGQQSHPK